MVQEHEHHWDFQPYTGLVRRGTCTTCRAVHFFPTSDSTAAKLQAQEANKLHSKLGHGHEFKPRQRIVPRGGGMETAGLPPVVPRPDVQGMNLQQKMTIGHKYYEANKEAILLWFDTVGELKMRKAWGISQATWGTKTIKQGLRNRWRPEVFGPYESAKKKPRTVESRKVTEKESEKADEEAQENPPPPDRVTKFLCAHCPAKFEKNADLTEHLALHSVAMKKIPDFPEFNNKWKKEVQIQWIKTYEAIFLKNKPAAGG